MTECLSSSASAFTQCAAVSGRALLTRRALLVKIRRDLENHVSCLLKNFGLVIGRANFGGSEMARTGRAQSPRAF